MASTLFQFPSFLGSSNIYEVNIRQYTAEGTFNAFAAHLPRLKDMGVEILWLMPVHPIGKEKRKGSLGSYYSVSDHEGVNPEFGTEADLKDLITKIHALGMKIILDWVANHTAWDHVWTKTNPDFFVKDESGNFKPPFDWDDVIQIDHDNKNEQGAMIAAMQYWITDFDIDGFRADLAHLTPLQFWKDARLQLSPFKKELIWLAETENINYHEAFDISFTWEWMHTTEKFARKETSLKDTVNVLKSYRNDFPENALRLFFTSNHDENSWNGTEYEKYGVLTKALAVFSCTFPGVPLLYSGQELPNMKRLLFFDKDEIVWPEKNELEDFYRRLLCLRKTNNALNAGVTVKLFEECIEQNVLAYNSSLGDDTVIVFLNMSDEKNEQQINTENVQGKYRDVFSGETVRIDPVYLFSGEAGGFKVFEKYIPADLR